MAILVIIARQVIHGQTHQDWIPLPRRAARRRAYTYHRKLAAPIARVVFGEVEMPWATGSRALTGGRAVKISLKTGDLKTARELWSVVHPQVEALVQLAYVRVAPVRSGAPDRLRPLNGLTAEEIRKLAAQARHDVLAADDLTWDPTVTSPLAAVIGRVAERTGQPGTHEHLERAAQLAEARLRKSLLRRRKVARRSAGASTRAS